MNRRGESIPLIGGRFCLGHSSTQTGRYQLPEAGQAPLLVVLQVRVTGPESRVDHIQSAQTDAIDLSSTVSSTEFRVPAYIPDPQVRFEGKPPIISVRVSMEKIPK